MNDNDNKSNDNISTVSGKMHLSSVDFFSNSNGDSGTEVVDCNDCNGESLQENLDSIEIPVSLELTEDEDTAPRPPISFFASIIPGEDDDDDLTTNNAASCSQSTGGAALESSVGARIPGNRPEYIANDGPSLPHPGAYYESAGDAKALIEKKKASSDAFPNKIMGTPNIQSDSHDNAQESSSQGEHDTEGQPTSSPGITQASVSADVARRKILYDDPQLGSDVMHLSNNESRDQTQRGLSFSRPFAVFPIRRVHQSSEMGDVPIPSTRSRKVRNVAAIVVLVMVFISVGIVIAVVTSSHKKSVTLSQTATTPSSQDDLPLSPPSDAPSDSVSLSNYKLHVCNPTDAFETETEFCIASNCFSGPHCSCDMYFRDTESRSLKGVCDSCRVCDLKSKFAFDCSNLGLSVQKCPTSSATDVEQGQGIDSISGADWGQYSPPDSYTDRFCIPSTSSLTELCYAGECTDDEKCRCDLYTRDISTGNIVGICDACGVCADGGFSSDCVNVGLTAMACSNADNKSSMTNDQTIDYDDDESPLTNDQTIQETSNIASPQLTIGRDEPSTNSYSEEDYTCTDPSNGVEICYARSCNEPGCTCDAYFRDSTSKESVGSCSSCMMCEKDAKNPVGFICTVYGIEMAIAC